MDSGTLEDDDDNDDDDDDDDEVDDDDPKEEDGEIFRGELFMRWIVGPLRTEPAKWPDQTSHLSSLGLE